MGTTPLYTHSRIGTKHLIEQYISSALATLTSLLDLTQYSSDLDTRDVLQQVLKARQSFGRSALLLSGGGTFGMNHIGVVKCLWQHKLLPRIISGASAGSIVCAVVCTRTDDEIPIMLKEFCHGDLEVFTRAGVDDSIMQRVAGFLKTGALFDIANMTRIMKELLGDLTFQEAHNRTRRILNICVSSASLFELPRLLNYVTAPSVLIWSAVAASCSVPLIYSPAGLLAKDSRTGNPVPWNMTPQRWIDGSVDNDLPMTRLAEMFNVNHFIVSQVNPHVVPFLAKEEGKLGTETSYSEAAVEAAPGWVNLLANLAKDEVMHRMHVLSELGMFSTLLTKTRSVLSQKYSGDITILPDVSFSQLHNVLRNPTEDFLLQAMLHGERATWPKLSRIQNHCAIELALDDAVQQLRARIAFSPSQVDLRMNVIVRPPSRAESESAHNKRKGSVRKHARFSTAGVTRTRRSLSSSESDSQRPGIRHAVRLRQPQLPSRNSKSLGAAVPVQPHSRECDEKETLELQDIDVVEDIAHADSGFDEPDLEIRALLIKEQPYHISSPVSPLTRKLSGCNLTPHNTLEGDMASPQSGDGRHVV